MTEETVAEKSARETREADARRRDYPANPAPVPAPISAEAKTQNQKDWEAEIARTNAGKKHPPVDVAGAEKLRKIVADQPSPLSDWEKEREAAGMAALARAANMVKKRKHEEEARIREENDKASIG